MDVNDPRPLLHEQSMNNDKFENDDPQACHIHQLKEALNRTRAIAVVILCIYVLSALAFALRLNSQNQFILPSQRMFHDIPTRVVTFQPDDNYQTGDPFASDTGPWIDLIPPGKGHIIVNDPQRWRLPQSWPVDWAHMEGPAQYTISMFHQLHCLASLKSSFETLTAIKEGKLPAISPHSDKLHGNHLNHCFDYLRQAIMCAGDTSLEKSMRVDGRLRRGVDGWGVQHQCKDFGWIFNYAAMHGRSNETGIA